MPMALWGLATVVGNRLVMWWDSPVGPDSSWYGRWGDGRHAEVCIGPGPRPPCGGCRPRRPLPRFGVVP